MDLLTPQPQKKVVLNPILWGGGTKALRCLTVFYSLTLKFHFQDIQVSLTVQFAVLH